MRKVTVSIPSGWSLVGYELHKVTSRALREDDKDCLVTEMALNESK